MTTESPSDFLDTIPRKEAIHVLRNASYCCSDCGKRWGHERRGFHDTWIAECHVCGDTKPVTTTQNFHNLTAGIQWLTSGT